MKSLLITLIAGISLTACGKSNSSSVVIPTFNRVKPPASGRVMPTADVEQIFSGTTEKQFTRGLYVEMTGTSTLNIIGQKDLGKGVLQNIDLNCPSQSNLKVISLGVSNQKTYVYTDTTLTSSVLTFNSTSNQYICGGTTSDHTIKVQVADLASNAGELIADLFTLDAGQTITYYDRGSTFLAYLTETKNEPSRTVGSATTDSSTSDKTTLLSFENPKNSPLLPGMISIVTSEITNFTSAKNVHLKNTLTGTSQTTSSGTLADLSSVAAQLKSIKVCEGPSDNQVCNSQDLSYLAL